MLYILLKYFAVAFQTSSGLRQGWNENTSRCLGLWSADLQEWEDMDTDHFSNTDHIPNESTDRKRRSCFASRDQCTDEDGSYADDIDIHIGR